SVLRLVQRQQIRALHDLEPYARSVSPLLLGADSLQHHHAAVFVVQEDSLEPAGALDHFVRRQYWHVARTVRDRRYQFAPRLPAVFVGHVPADAVGLGHVHRHDRFLLYAPVLVYSLPADDLDLRDAHDPAGSGGGGVGWIEKTSDSSSHSRPVTRRCWPI